MMANQRSQQETFNELTKANKDKANDAMFDEIDQVCRISGCDFRTEIIKKATGVVHKGVMVSTNCSDDELLSKLRGCFSDVPTMNQAREELRNMRQRENESVIIYAY